jgi:hypothetical protein
LDYGCAGPDEPPDISTASRSIAELHQLRPWQRRSADGRALDIFEFEPNGIVDTQKREARVFHLMRALHGAAATTMMRTLAVKLSRARINTVRSVVANSL